MVRNRLSKFERQFEVLYSFNYNSSERKDGVLCIKLGECAVYPFCSGPTFYIPVKVEDRRVIPDVPGTQLDNKESLRYRDKERRALTENLTGLIPILAQQIRRNGVKEVRGRYTFKVVSPVDKNSAARCVRHDGSGSGHQKYARTAAL